MNRPWNILTAAGILAGSLTMAAPAEAGLTDCELGPAPETTFIEGEIGNHSVYPLRAVDDARAVATWISNYVTCLEGGLAASLIDCVGQTMPGLPRVTVDPETPAIHVEYDDPTVVPAC